MITLKFTTDGSPAGSHVYVVETGEEVKNVRSVTIRASAKELATMTLELIHMQVKALGKAGVAFDENGNLVLDKVECVPLVEVEARAERKVSNEKIS
uniref:Uncharacterized protein n=1 Tax=viral metagenome TaxID=1070528 RepID=A0A6M3M396_9ZZZZ